MILEPFCYFRLYRREERRIRSSNERGRLVRCIRRSCSIMTAGECLCRFFDVFSQKHASFFKARCSNYFCQFFFRKTSHHRVTQKTKTRKETRLMMTTTTTTTTMMMKSVVASSDYNYYRLNVAKASTTSNNSGSSKTNNNNKLDRRRTMLGLFGVGVSSSSNNKNLKIFRERVIFSTTKRERRERHRASVERPAVASRVSIHDKRHGQIR